MATNTFPLAQIVPPSLSSSQLPLHRTQDSRQQPWPRYIESVKSPRLSSRSLAAAVAATVAVAGVVAGTVAAATVATLTPFPFASVSCDAAATAMGTAAKPPSKINDVQNPYKQQQRQPVAVRVTSTVGSHSFTVRVSLCCSRSCSRSCNRKLRCDAANIDGEKVVAGNHKKRRNTNKAACAAGAG